MPTEKAHVLRDRKSPGTEENDWSVYVPVAVREPKRGILRAIWLATRRQMIGCSPALSGEGLADEYRSDGAFLVAR